MMNDVDELGGPITDSRNAVGAAWRLENAQCLSQQRIFGFGLEYK
jgi:hypothetical protein